MVAAQRAAVCVLTNISGCGGLCAAENYMLGVELQYLCAVVVDPGDGMDSGMRAAPVSGGRAGDRKSVV